MLSNSPGSSDFPVRHLSFRVPWHDTAWVARARLLLRLSMVFHIWRFITLHLWRAADQTQFSTPWHCAQIVIDDAMCPLIVRNFQILCVET
jgi:hypothetical protein